MFYWRTHSRQRLVFEDSPKTWQRCQRHSNGAQMHTCPSKSLASTDRFRECVLLLASRRIRECVLLPMHTCPSKKSCLYLQILTQGSINGVSLASLSAARRPALSSASASPFPSFLLLLSPHAPRAAKHTCVLLSSVAGSTNAGTWRWARGPPDTAKRCECPESVAHTTASTIPPTIKPAKQRRLWSILLIGKKNQLIGRRPCVNDDSGKHDGRGGD